MDRFGHSAVVLRLAERAGVALILMLLLTWSVTPAAFGQHPAPIAPAQPLSEAAMRTNQARDMQEVRERERIGKLANTAYESIHALYHSTGATITPAARAARVIHTVLITLKLTPEEVCLQARDAELEEKKENHPRATAGGAALGLLVQTAYAEHDSLLIAELRRQGFDFAAVPSLALLAGLVTADDTTRMRAFIDALADRPLPPMIAYSVYQFCGDTGFDGRTVARYAAIRLRHPGPSATPFGLQRLKALTDRYPPLSPTDPSWQGSVGKYDSKLHIYVPMRPERVPEITAGQKFFCLGDDAKGIRLSDTVTGREVPPTRFALRELTLVSAEAVPKPVSDGKQPLESTDDEKRLTFHLEGYGNLVQWQGVGGIYEIPDLYPTVEDHALRHLRASYVGKRVWGYGGISFNAYTGPGLSASISMQGDGPVTIRRIERLRAGRPFRLAMGTSPGYMGERESAFETRDPLVVIIETPENFKVGSSSYSSMETGDSPEALQASLQAQMKDSKGPAGRGFYTICADRWDFERLFSPVSLKTASRKWPPTFRRAVAQGNLREGMTPEMVVWTTGWPGEFGTLEELSRLSVWHYDDLPPYTQDAYFKNGRFLRWYSVQLP